MSFTRASWPSIFAIILLLLNLFFPNYINAASMLGNETDKTALLAFKSQITDDPQRIFQSWNSSSNFCEWTGVTCGDEQQRVTSLNLKGRKLDGKIAPHIGNLSFLHRLDLSDNYLRGGIPAELGNLGRLEILNMSSNFLLGQVPVTLSRCSNLVRLLLRRNFLIGKIPTEIGSLDKLVMLDLRSNNLTGTIPSSIGNLTFLRLFDVSYNKMSGEIPYTISQLVNLKYFLISVNNFFGEFPPQLYNLTSLEEISLPYNSFTGTIRSSIGVDLPNLKLFYVAFNFFTGRIPDSFSNATELEGFDVLQNNFTGKVPLNFGSLRNLKVFSVGYNLLGSGGNDDLRFFDSLTNCSNLEFLSIGGNQFGGILPISIRNLSTTLTQLFFEMNQIRGTLFKEITNLKSLHSLAAFENNLVGPIPEEIGLLSNLGTAFLNSNKLTGEIPPSFGNISRLQRLFLFDNNLTGTIPMSLSNCNQLALLDLNNNNLSGTIEPLMGLTSLLSFNVSRNSLTGFLPLGFGNLSQLIDVDLSHNQFSGEIPNTIGKCLSIDRMWMQGNSLQGSIPSLKDLQSLEYLDLSSNNLTGEIPSYLANISTLIQLNLSFNDLEGEVPVKGVFSNLSAVSIIGNPKVCGGINELRLPKCSTKIPQTSHKKNAISLKLILIIASICAISALSLIVFLLYWIKYRKRIPRSTSPSMEFYDKISYDGLLKATDRFSSENLIGSGGFGTVYKGNLGPDRLPIVVKVLNLEQRGASKSFLAECQALRNIRHRNLVQIITACSSTDFQGSDFKALVYKFMPNGSLDGWLHSEGNNLRLDIVQRINIAIDVASALYYLHHQCQMPIVHCDLKPQNVLIDENLTAYVGDFGLARLLPTEAISQQLSSLGIKGTIGYAAPEYGMGSRVSTQGDVYSFGILLLEIFTGRKPTDEVFQENTNLHHFVKMGLRTQAMELILDESALHSENQSAEEVGASSNLRTEQRTCLASILELGVSCSAESPLDRRNMEEVFKELRMIKDKFVKA